MSESSFTLNVVSPQFPCGAAWLANALLELQVPLSHLWGFETAGEWEVLSGGASRYCASHLPWRQTLAALQLGREFHFIDDVRPRFTHAFPWQLAPSQKTIWMVRDPRDALHSEWRRHLRNGLIPGDMPFPEFMRMPFFGGPVSMVDMLWLHLRAWQSVAQACPQEVLLLRFEDWKRQPLPSLAAVAQWMGMETDEESLRRACLGSDVSHLQAIEQSLMLDDPRTPQYNRRGSILEWEGTWTREWHAALGPEWGDLLGALGYEPLRVVGRGGGRCDLAAMLAWRGLEDTAAASVWERTFSTIHIARSAGA